TESATRLPRRPLARAAAAAWALLIGACAADAPASDRLVIGYVVDTTRADGWRGAQLGGAEVQRAAELIGRELNVHVEPATDSAIARAAATRLLESGATAII